jgi:oligopeptide/dipeptide ABC transporter ATP-binding protein
VPRLDRIGVAELESIPGRPPDLIHRPWGCAFAPRCPHATSICHEEEPALTTAGERHHAACWHQDRVMSDE